MSKIGINVDYLSSIAGTSPTSLYAVGQHDEIGGYSGRVLRNTGAGWSDIALPPTADIYSLTAAVSTAPNVAWVAGTTNPGQGVLLQLIGSTATQVTLPAAPAGYTAFDTEFPPGLSSAGGSDLWFGGNYYSENGAFTSRVYHRTASGGWTTTVMPTFVTSIDAVSTTVAYVGGGGLFKITNGTVSSVALTGNPVDVYSVVATGADDVWTLGATDTAAQVIDHFDGTGWTSVPLPDLAATGTLNAIAVAPNGTLWATGAATSVVTGFDESTLARFDPVSGTWASTHAAADIMTGNLPVGSPFGLLALSSGNVYMVGGGGLAPTPVAAKLCQLPASLSGGASTVGAAALGDGVLVTSPHGMTGSATVSDTTGLLRTGPLHAGQGAALPGLAAGTFTLRTTAGSATATFAVPPTSSTFNYKTTVTIATEAAPTGYAYQVQLMRPGSTTWVATPLSAKSNGVAKYLYSVLYPAGNYLLRSRVERLATSTSPAVFSGWSPAVTAVVES